MTKNIELLKQVKDSILMDPDSHDQKTWFCDTSMCIAGHAAVMSGATVQASRNYSDLLEMVDEHGNMIHPPEYAQEALGLSDDEREYLFYCMNNAVSLKRMDQVIQLWEEGKEIDDLPEEELIEDPDESDRE